MTTVFKTAKHRVMVHWTELEKIDYIAFWNVTTLGFRFGGTIWVIQENIENEKTKTKQLSQVQKGIPDTVYSK